jgi:hypothetical protein
MCSTFANYMNIDRRLIYQLAGVSMIVGSFFVAARAIGGAITIIYFLTATDFTDDTEALGETIKASLMATQIPAAISGMASFLILFYGGRWMIRGPRMIERWIKEGRTHDEGLSTDTKQLSEQDAPPNP